VDVRIATATSLLLATAAWGTAWAQDASTWLDWRGPTADGIAPASAKPPTEWDVESGKNILWSMPLHGQGHSSPIVVDGQVWITAATDDGKEQSVIVADLETGESLLDEVLFKNEKPDPLSNSVNNYAAPSCTAELGRVYVHFGSYGTACYDTSTREVLWERRDLPCNHWRGPASSPVLYKDLLILTFDGADLQYLTALDKATGKEVWKTERSTPWDDLDKDGKPMADGDFRKSFSTPIIRQIDGRDVLLSTASKCFFGYDPATGTELWQRFHSAGHTGSPRPLYHEGIAYMNTGFGKAQLHAIRVDGSPSGALADDRLLWERRKNVPNRATPVLVGDRIYSADDGGIASCADLATGDALWRERLEGGYSGSPVFAGGLLYFTSDQGLTTVIRPGDQFDLVGENHLETDPPHNCGASAAVIGNTLVLRSGGALYRIGE